MRVELDGKSMIRTVSSTTFLPSFDERVEVHPEERLFFRARGLTTPEDFLSIPGEIVSGHPDRHVMRVELALGRIGYLKREHRIRFKERFQNWRAGFGWVSKSIREGLSLQRLEMMGFAGPKWLAFGEDGKGRAFLLIQEATGAEDLRRLWFERRLATHVRQGDAEDLAVRLGRLCAELHAAGIDHPDFYAKHVLIDSTSKSICILDWQRATIKNLVPWKARIRALAALYASLPKIDERSDRRLQALFLWAYRRVARCDRRSITPPFSALARRIEHEARRLSERRGIREQRQLPLPNKAQRLVWLDGEALCAIPDVVEDLKKPALRNLLYDAAKDGSSIILSYGRQAKLSVGRFRNPMTRMFAWLRGKSWRSPHLRLARLLFHLERHHVSASRLLAYGQRTNGWNAEAFLLIEEWPVDAEPLVTALRQADNDLRERLMMSFREVLSSLHEAGCEGCSALHFSVQRVRDSFVVAVSDFARLSFQRHLSARRRATDIRRCLESIKITGRTAFAVRTST